MTESALGDVLVTHLGGHLLGFDAHRVSAIDDARGPAAGPEADLAELLGLIVAGTGSGPRSRRVVRLDGPRGSLRLVAGADLAIAPLEHVEELPSFLAGLCGRACIRSLFSLDGVSLGFLLDADALLVRSGAQGRP